jgi:hypothetical protein
MKFCRLIAFVISLLFYSNLFAQKPYFQQKVDYKINVSLDDQKNRLLGNITIKYHNQSPDTLKYILLHLWPNAYKNTQTAFSTQFIENGKRDFHFSKKEDRGSIDSLNFMVNGKESKFTFYADQPDIAKLELPTPLAPGQSITIYTPFRVKIPKSVSRLGHIDNSYQITQWYPKPAVYDLEGWHPIPYLDQGEFYSEFGSFDVSITLPQNYVVAATGELQNKEEWDFIEQIIRNSEKQNFDYLSLTDQIIPASDTIFKTIQFKAENVHDFAWFADKRFYILKDEARLPSGKKIDCYAYFTNVEAQLWKKGAEYTSRAVEFYSKTVGEYPYPHATAVQSALGAGGGMEYPMITVIGKTGDAKSLDIVIAHEVGHNWFYGILASNEREYAWMDEGFNSYVESRYSDKYYPNSKEITPNLVYLTQARRAMDQASNTPSQNLSSINYFLGAYAKPTMVLRYLEEYLGVEKMDRILNKYYEEWKFKHPYPEDLRRIFEKESKEKLSWIFDDLLFSNKKLDYSISKTERKNGKLCLTIKNKGEIAAPFSISSLDKNNSILNTIWFDAIQTGKDSIICLEINNVAKCRLDASGEMPEMALNNNEYKTSGLFKLGTAPKFRFLANPQKPEYPYINFAPALGFNTNNGFMLGMAFYNTPIPAKKWDYSIVPLYAFESKSLVGMFELRRNFYFNKGKIQNFSTGLAIKSFDFFEKDNFDYSLRFVRFNPHFIFNFRKKEARSYEEHQLRFDNFITTTETAKFDTIGYTGKETNLRSTHRLSHTFKNKKPLAPFSILSQLEYANYTDGFGSLEHYIKLSLEGNFKFYYQKNKTVDLRIFAAGFPFNSDRSYGEFPLHLASRNSNDYHFDEHIYGRNESSGFFSNQINLREGGFKTPIDIGQSYSDGRSNSFILALNFKADIPVNLPFGSKFIKLKPYVDLGYFQNTAPSVTITSISEQIMYSGGIMIDINDGTAGIYFPIFYSKNLGLLMRQRGNFWEQISFNFNLNRLHPREIVYQTFDNF